MILCACVFSWSGVGCVCIQRGLHILNFLLHRVVTPHVNFVGRRFLHLLSEQAPVKDHICRYPQKLRTPTSYAPNHSCVIGTIHAHCEAIFVARLASDVVEAAAFWGLRPLVHQSGQEAVSASGPTPRIERFERVTSTKAHESFKRAAPCRTCKTTRLGV